MAPDNDGEQLAYGGVCPVCGDEFIDAMESLELDTSYKAKVCILPEDEIRKGQGEMLIHLPNADE